MKRKLHILRHTKLTPTQVVKPGDVFDIGTGEDEVPPKVAHEAIAYGNARELSEEEVAKAPDQGAAEGGSIEERDPKVTNRDPQRRK